MPGNNMRQLARAGFWALAATPLAAQFVPPPTGFTQATGYMNISVRYKEVPGSICESTPGAKTYTGYVDVADNIHMFFWLFEARHRNPTTAPLSLWIDGGPGTPSTSGLFDESGPCDVDSNGNLYLRQDSWNNVTNMLYIDQPVGVGFSYTKAVPGYHSDGALTQLPSNDCPEYLEDQASCGTWSSGNPMLTANSTMAAAPTFWMTMQGILGAFPQYSSNGFHLFSISYGGHYGPLYGDYIVQQNAMIGNRSSNSSGAHHIDLRSVIIGNGWYDPLIQNEAYYNYTVDPGNTYDLALVPKKLQPKMYNQLWGPGNCIDMLQQCQATGWDDVCTAADNYCYIASGSINPDRDFDDIRELTTGAGYFPYDFYPDYLNQEHVLEAIGARVNYSDGNNIIYNTFESTGDDARIDGTIDRVRDLVEKRVYVVEYAGDADINCNWLGGEVIAAMSGPRGYETAGYVNISTPDHVVHGQVKQNNNFAFARIYQAGHSVSFYQPLTALEILDRVINGKDVATGQINVVANGNYSTKGTAKSTYREGRGTVVNYPLPLNATYNTTTNMPNPPATKGRKPRRSSLLKRKRLVNVGTRRQA